MSKSIYRDLFFALSFHPKLTPAAHKLFNAYVTRHGREGAWPSLDTLEQLIKMSRKTIIRAKSELRDAGLIEIYDSQKKKSDLVFIPLLVEYFHRIEVENLHHENDVSAPVEFLSKTGGKFTPEVGLLNNQVKKKDNLLPVVSGKITPEKSGKITPEKKRPRGRKGGRPKVVDAVRFQKALDLYDAEEETVQNICDRFELSKPTFYRYLKAQRG